MKLNMPTKLTFTRMVLSGVIILLMLFPWFRIGVEFPDYYFHGITIDLEIIISGIIFIIASLTDFLDGYLARKNNQVTDFGKFIDAIADKVLVNSVLIIFAAKGIIPCIIPVIIVVRDIIVDAIRMSAAGKGKVQAAKMSGKLKTATLMIGMVLTFFYNLPFELLGIDVANAFLYFGALMSLVSMYEYYKLNKKYIL